MSVTSNLQIGFSRLVQSTGTNCLFKYYTRDWADAGSVWDDPTGLTISGTLGVSGIVLPINALNGTRDFLLQEQGLLAEGDQKLFVAGNIDFGNITTGSDNALKIQIGSPSGDNYGLVDMGIIKAETQGTGVYKKAYIRRLTNGSLIGES